MLSRSRRRSCRLAPSANEESSSSSSNSNSKNSNTNSNSNNNNNTNELHQAIIGDHISNLIDCIYRYEEFSNNTAPPAGIFFTANNTSTTTSSTTTTTSNRHSHNHHDAVVRLGKFRLAVEAKHVKVALKQLRKVIVTTHDVAVSSSNSNSISISNHHHRCDLVHSMLRYETLLDERIPGRHGGTSSRKDLIRLFSDLQEDVIDRCAQSAGMTIHTTRSSSSSSSYSFIPIIPPPSPIPLPPSSTTTNTDPHRPASTTRTSRNRPRSVTDGSGDDSTTTTREPNNKRKGNSTSNSNTTSTTTASQTKPNNKNRKTNTTTAATTTTTKKDITEFSRSSYPDEASMEAELLAVKTPLTSDKNLYTAWDDLHILHHGAIGAPYNWEDFRLDHVRLAKSYGWSTSFKSKTKTQVYSRYKVLNPELGRNRNYFSIEDRKRLCKQYLQKFSSHEWKE